MRKTRLVILPGVRSLKTIGCLLLFLACPTIAFKGQENREVEPLCKAEDLKEFWVEESPWPGDVGGITARTTALGSRPPLDILTKQTCNLDVSNRKVKEPQRTLLLERRIVAERRETERKLDSSVLARSKSQNNARNRLDHWRDERVADARVELNGLPDDSRVVNIRERINKENGRRDANRMNRSNMRSLDRQTRADVRERVEGDNVLQRLPLGRKTRSMENSRNYNRVRSHQHEHNIRDATHERIYGGERKIEGRRREQNWDGMRESRMDRDDKRDSRLVIRFTRSTENVRWNDKRVLGGVRDMVIRHAHSRRNDDSRREATSVERAERLDRNRVDVRRRQVDMRNARSLEDVTRNERRLGMSARANRENSESRMQTRRVDRDMLARNRIRMSNSSTRENDSDRRINIADLKGSTFSMSSEEKRLDRKPQRVASHDMRSIESRRNGDVRRETRSLERIQGILDVRQVNDNIQVSGILARTTGSVPDVRRSNRIEIHQQRTVNAGSRIVNYDVRDLSDGHRTVSRDEMNSRRSSSGRLNDGQSRDMRHFTREPEQTRETGKEVRGKEAVAVLRTVQRATDSTRIIRSKTSRPQLDGAIRLMREDRESRREGGMKRVTRSLKKLGNEHRLVNEADVRTGRNERYSVARFQRNDVRSVDSLRRLVSQTPLASYERETGESDTTSVRKYRTKNNFRDMWRRMDARSSSAEWRDSGVENLVRVLVKDSRYPEDGRRTEIGARVISNERDSRCVYDSDRRNDHLRRIAMNRVDLRLPNRRVESARNYRGIRKVESRSEDDRRYVRSLEREMSNVNEHTRRLSMDNRSSRLVRDHSAEDTGRRAESRRLGHGRFDNSREVRNSALGMNHNLKERQTNMRRMQISTPDIRSTESMRRSTREAQFSRADRDVSQIQNLRLVDDRRERGISQVNLKPADVRRTHSEKRSFRFNTGSRQLDQTHKSREETRRTDSRRDGRRNFMRIVREVESFDETRGETRKILGTIQSIENVNEIRRSHKDARTRVMRGTRAVETPNSADRRRISAESVTHKWTTAAHNAESMFMSQKTGYYEAVKSVVTNWMAIYDIKMTDVSRLGETMMFGGIVCYALFANVNKKYIF